MAEARALDWTEFNRAAPLRPARELLQRTLGFFHLEARPPGVAVDLGAGAGSDAVELLRRGWTVHAVDANVPGLERLRERVPPEAADRLIVHARRYETFALPRCDLVWAGWSLPFCPQPAWPRLLRRIERALRPGGRFAGDFFGPRHAWHGEEGHMTIGKAALRAQLAEHFKFEAFDVEDGWRVAGNGRLTRWHAFGVAVRKPA